MKSINKLAVLFVLILASGCASTKVTDRETYSGPTLARPQRILVYDFAATRADIPAWAAGYDSYAGAEPAQTAEQLATGRKLGDQVAQQLVKDIQGMGLPAQQADEYTAFDEGDYAIVGYFESVDKGSAVKRIALGFGSGAASMQTRVEGYEMTATGPRKLGSGQVSSGDGKSPGLLVPLAVTLATANPIGLVVGGAIKAGQAATGHDTVEGVAKRTSKEISDQLREAFQRQGWI